MTAIGNIISSPVKQMTKGADKNAEENAQIADLFSGIMQQSKEGFPQYDGVDSKDEVLNLTGTQSKSVDNSIDRDVANMSSSKRIESKPQDTDKISARQKITDKIENVKDTTKSIKDVIKTAYGLSDEELEKAMADLGITEFDLLDTKNLVALVKEITGVEDVSSLLADPVFKDVYSQVNEIVGDFMKAEGLDNNGLNELIAIMDETVIDDSVDIDPEMLDAVDKVTDNVINDISVKDNAITDSASQIDVEVTTENQLGTSVVADELPGENEKADVTNTQISSDEEVMVQTKEDVNPVNTNIEDKSEDYSDETENSSPRRTVRMDATSNKSATVDSETTDDVFVKETSTDTKPEFNASVNNFADSSPVSTEAPEMMPEMPQPAYTYDDIQNLMDQVNGMFRTFSTAEETTIQMQLNPENLGKLFMSVSEKDGAVTAQITTTSEESKDMLLTQLIELRSNLQLQGIKVEAVEVSVATHEFEQNLESDNSTGREMSEQQQRESLDGQPTGRRRNISLDNLDELQGVMSEEEAIVASMMRTNGQTVDYTA